ncbi:hypothetical protein VULLAG_LOCUS21497 [Vulpes lagopus]
MAPGEEYIGSTALRKELRSQGLTLSRAFGIKGMKESPLKDQEENTQGNSGLTPGPAHVRSPGSFAA